MERYETLFAQLKARREGAFVPFVTLGDPNPEQSLKIIDTLIEAGADALELGIPFSDPLADGPTIQDATLRAFAAGVTPAQCFEMLTAIRQKHPTIPIGLLMYANLVFSPGIDEFYAACERAGVDSVLVADVPVEESAPFRQAALRHNIAPIFICPPNADDDLLLVSRDGQAVRFAATDEQLRPMGRSTSGVRGMKFRGDDELLAMDVPREGTDLLIVTDSGYAKRTPIEEYPTKGRGTMGVRVGRLVEERGGLVGALVVDPEEDIMVITESGKLVQVNASDVRPTARNTMGVIFARPDGDDRIIAVTRNPERDIDEEESEEAQAQDNSSQSNDETPAEDVASEHDDSQEVQE